MRVTVVLIAVVLTSCGSPAAAPTASPSPSGPPSPLSRAPLEACGTVKAWTAPTDSQPGSITFGTQTHSVNAGTRHGQTGFTPTVGRDMCLFGGLDGQTATSHGATTVESPFCGAVLAFTPATAATAGSIVVLHFAAATLAVPAGIDLGRPPSGARRCLTVGVDAAGDPLARGPAGPSILDMELDLWCGSVKTYAAGSVIAIGSKRWDMAAGAAYQSAAVNPPDRTEPGKPTCLTAAIDDSGLITRYTTKDMPTQEGGTVTSYTAPTATAPGTLVFSYKFVRAVAAGASLSGMEPGTHVCVKDGLDAAGDRVVTAAIDCPPVQVN